MANVNTKAHVLVRDGFVCQRCGGRIVLAQAVKLIDAHVPGAQLWDRHGRLEPLRTRWATVDHIIPEVHGGMDLLDNLVACCVSCNSSKGGAVTEPHTPNSMCERWDGLGGIFLHLAGRYPTLLSSEDRKWLAALQREGVKPGNERVEEVAAFLRADPPQALAVLDAFPCSLTPEELTPEVNAVAGGQP